MRTLRASYCSSQVTGNSCAMAAMPPAPRPLVSITLAHNFSDVLARSYDESYAMGEGSAATRPVYYLCSCLSLCCTRSQSSSAHTSKHK